MILRSPTEDEKWQHIAAAYLDLFPLEGERQDRGAFPLLAATAACYSRLHEENTLPVLCHLGF
jgi:hypothetical protein